MPFLRSTQEQLQDRRDESESGWALVHIDTCLGGYLQDHHNRDGELLLGVHVDGTTTVGEVFDGLASEFNAIGFQMGETRKGFDYDQAKATIERTKERHADRLDIPFDSTLEVPSDDEDFDGESCQAWFLITWNVPEEAS